MTPLQLILLLATTTALQPERVFIGGLGYCGLRIAEKFHDTYGCKVAGCVRSAEKQAALTKRYPWLEAHVLDLDNTYQGLNADGRAALASATPETCALWAARYPAWIHGVTAQ